MTSFIPLSPTVIAEAHDRIACLIHQTPVVTSGLLNSWLGHDVYFKVEGLQKIGAFKVRGALNALLTLKEKNSLPEQVVAFSSGNHAQAVAYASHVLGIRATILIPKFASKVKQQATRSYGADVLITETRHEAEGRIEDFQQRGAYFIHPYDNDDIIAGQGTSCWEAIQQLKENLPDAVFASCGGGGWLSGTFLATQLLSPNSLVYGAEPEQANDAAESLKKGEIVKLSATPETIADGARTLAISERTFHYLRRLAGIYEISEQEIIYWTQWLNHLLKVAVEPTSAMAMAGAWRWLQEQREKRTVLVLLSGGNMDSSTYRKVFAESFIHILPNKYHLIDANALRMPACELAYGKVTARMNDSGGLVPQMTGNR